MSIKTRKKDPQKGTNELQRAELSKHKQKKTKKSRTMSQRAKQKLGKRTKNTHMGRNEQNKYVF